MVEVTDIAYEVTCPHCQARPQEPCVLLWSRRPVDVPHILRQFAARDRGANAS